MARWLKSWGPATRAQERKIQFSTEHRPALRDSSQFQLSRATISGMVSHEYLHCESSIAGVAAAHRVGAVNLRGASYCRHQTIEDRRYKALTAVYQICVPATRATQQTL